MSLKSFGYLFVFALIFIACGSSKKSANSTLESQQKEIAIFPYDLSEAVLFELPKILNEISGLSLSENKDQLVAIQDENGILFFINKKTGTVEKEINFQKDGDYEGVAYAYGKYFVLKSSGTIYEINLEEKDAKYIKHKYQLSHDTDHEGITYDEVSDMLIIACKDSKGLQGIDNNTRCLYCVDVKGENTEILPVITLKREAVKTYLLENLTMEEIEESFSKIFDEGLDYLHLGPSGIAINPLTGNYYLLSSKGKLLAVVDRNNKILKVIKFDKKIFPQPEGITFDTDGTMYVASEKAKNNTAVIGVFKVQN